MTDWTVIAPFAVAMAQQLGAHDPEPVIADGPAGHLEHLIHELCHAELLCLPLGPELSYRIGAAIGRLTMVEQVAAEAMAWAVEWEAWQILGLVVPHGPFSWPDAVDAAEIQGVPQAVLCRLRDQHPGRWRRHAERVLIRLRGLMTAEDSSG